MAEIERYTFEDSDGNEVEWSTFSATEAREYAQKYGYAMIANTYEWTEDELVEDYRPGHNLDGTPIELDNNSRYEHPDEDYRTDGSQGHR